MSPETPKKHASETTTKNRNETTTMSTRTIKKLASMSTESPTAPATTALPVVLSTTPPVLDLPVIPTTFNPVILDAYRGYRVRTGQLAAIPDVQTELTSSDAFDEAMSPTAPKAAVFAQQLGDAVGWTRARGQLEALLGYTKSQEAVTWKTALLAIDEVKKVYEFLLPKNPDLPKTLPALARLVAATNAGGQKAAAARSKNVKSKAKENAALAASVTPAATPAPAAATAPVATPSTTPVGGGGAAH